MDHVQLVCSCTQEKNHELRENCHSGYECRDDKQVGHNVHSIFFLWIEKKDVDTVGENVGVDIVHDGPEPACQWVHSVIFQGETKTDDEKPKD